MVETIKSQGPVTGVPAGTISGEKPQIERTDSPVSMDTSDRPVGVWAKVKSAVSDVAKYLSPLSMAKRNLDQQSQRYKEINETADLFRSLTGKSQGIKKTFADAVEEAEGRQKQTEGE